MDDTHIDVLRETVESLKQQAIGYRLIIACALKEMGGTLTIKDETFAELLKGPERMIVEKHDWAKKETTFSLQVWSEDSDG